MQSRRQTIGFAIASVILLLAGPAFADGWPQWRGPNRDGISKETGLLKEWPKDGPQLLWQMTEVGGGFATPSVDGARIYLLSNKGVGDESVRAFNVKDGSPIWTTRVGKVGNPDQRPNYPGARSTPTVDGLALYALGSDGDLLRLESDTGKIRWSKSLRTDFTGKPGVWAYSESPLVDDDMVVCTPGGPDATVVALSKESGDVVWKCAVPGEETSGYASVVIFEGVGAKEYVAYTAGGLLGLDAKTGKFLWRYDKTKGAMGMSILTPIVHDDLVYSGASRVGGGAVRLVSHEDAVKPEQVYFDTKLPTAIGGAVLVGDYLYGSGGQTVVCAEFKTGQIKWSDRSIAPGSLCYADGMLYLHGENGAMALIEATPEAYREHGRFEPLNPPEHPNRMEKAWAYPVIADGKLYIRDTECLWCYDIKGAGTSK